MNKTFFSKPYPIYTIHNDFIKGLISKIRDDLCMMPYLTKSYNNDTLKLHKYQVILLKNNSIDNEISWEAIYQKDDDINIIKYEIFDWLDIELEEIIRDNYNSDPNESKLYIFTQFHYSDLYSIDPIDNYGLHIDVDSYID